MPKLSTSTTESSLLMLKTKSKTKRRSGTVNNLFSLITAYWELPVQIFQDANESKIPKLKTQHITEKFTTSEKFKPVG